MPLLADCCPRLESPASVRRFLACAALVGVMRLVYVSLVPRWLPPRTVLLYDVAAGFGGVVLGPMLWAIGGSFFERGITRFLTLPRFSNQLTNDGWTLVCANSSEPFACHRLR